MQSTVRRYLVITGLVLVPIACIGAVARTVMKQTRGPLPDEIAGASRHSSFAGAPAPVLTRVEGNGMVEPLVPEARLVADVPGRVSALYVTEGQDVAEGAPLAEVENVVHRAQVARAEAELAAAGAELQRIMHGMRAEDVNAIASEAVAAKARAAIAASELARTEELVKNGSAASAELDVSKRRAEAERAAARAATERASGASAGARAEDVLQAQARVKAATASLEEARGALARTKVLAPRAGRVLRIKLHLGEYHNPAAEPLIILGDVSRLRVRMDVDERDIGRLKLDANAQVTATAFGGRKFPAKVVEISKHMGRRTVRVDDPKDRIDVKVLEVVLELADKPPLVPGMRVLASVDAAPSAI
jgi:HlyD family secretion protein